MLGRRNAQSLACGWALRVQSRYAQMGGPDVIRDRSRRCAVRATWVVLWRGLGEGMLHPARAPGDAA